MDRERALMKLRLLTAAYNTFNTCGVMNIHLNAEDIEAFKVATKALERQETGTWIEHADENGATFECSACHEISGWCYNFCPNCGNDKRGDEE